MKETWQIRGSYKVSSMAGPGAWFSLTEEQRVCSPRLGAEERGGLKIEQRANRILTFVALNTWHRMLQFPNEYGIGLGKGEKSEVFGWFRKPIKWGQRCWYLGRRRNRQRFKTPIVFLPILGSREGMNLLVSVIAFN